jgi:hypothetical protein
VSVAEAEAGRSYRNASESLNQQRKRVRASRDACDEAGQELRRARTLRDLASNARSLLGFERRLELAEAAQKHANELAAQLLSFTVTEQGLQAARLIDARRRQINATLEAQASRVTLDLLPTATSLIRVNGEYMPSSSLTAIEDLIIEIEGVGTIRIQPGIKDRDTQLTRKVDEQRLLRNALATIAVDTLEQAETQYSARQRCEQGLTEATKEIARHTPSDPDQKISAGIESLRNHIAVLRTAHSNGLTLAKLERAPEPDSAREALAAAELREAELSQVVEIEQAPMPELEEEQLQMLQMHAQAESELRSALKQHQERTLEHEQALLRESAEALASRRASAAQAVVVQRSVLEQLKTNRPIDSVAVMDLRIARYLDARKLFGSSRTRTQQEIAILESRIEREEGVGIQEQLAEAERRRDELEVECSRFKREIKVLELLRTTLEEAEQEAKERYMTPVIKRITPYLQHLFPGAAIDCDENFRITGVMRELQQADLFEGLSDGTQEQIAVLTRLAFADMLLDSGRPAMVILDDALAYSDSERLERMFDLLTQAATRSQILILTCRGELFTRLGGNRVRAVCG